MEAASTLDLDEGMDDYPNTPVIIPTNADLPRVSTPEAWGVEGAGGGTPLRQFAKEVDDLLRRQHSELRKRMAEMVKESGTLAVKPADSVLRSQSGCLDPTSNALGFAKRMSSDAVPYNPRRPSKGRSFHEIAQEELDFHPSPKTRDSATGMRRDSSDDVLDSMSSIPEAPVRAESGGRKKPNAVAAAAPKPLEHSFSDTFELPSDLNLPGVPNRPHCFEVQGASENPSALIEVVNTLKLDDAAGTLSTPTRAPEPRRSFVQKIRSDDNESDSNAPRVGPKDSYLSIEGLLDRKVKKRQTANGRTKQMRRGEGWRADLLRLTHHGWYETVNASLILLNALLIAWETHVSAQRVQANATRDDAVFTFFMFFFCFVFSVDLAIRLVAQGVIFFTSIDLYWNLFDIVVVLGSILEVVFWLGDKKSWLTNASVVRLARLARVVRIARALRSFAMARDLRITVSMLCSAFVPLITFSSLMSAVFMVFAIFFTDGATAHVAAGNGFDDGLIRYYGNLWTTMCTLYKAISGGVDWENVLEPLERLPALYTVGFYVYVQFSVVAMLNVVSAMFIDKTITKSKSDRDFIVQTENQNKRDFLDTMDNLFEELDRDGSGHIDLEELQTQFMAPKVHSYLRALDLNVWKVKELFALMDTDGSGDIDRKEFAQGCTRLRGEAKELDVAILQYEVKLLSSDCDLIKNLLLKLGSHIDDRLDEVSAY